ncbi:hypothetical protein [Paenibacillus thalictri]|nr:hypothetical protein [Paenibacillus thalictri]
MKENNKSASKAQSRQQRQHSQNQQADPLKEGYDKKLNGPNRPAD